MSVFVCANQWVSNVASSCHIWQKNQVNAAAMRRITGWKRPFPDGAGKMGQRLWILRIPGWTVFVEVSITDNQLIFVCWDIQAGSLEAFYNCPASLMYSSMILEEWHCKSNQVQVLKIWECKVSLRHCRVIQDDSHQTKSFKEPCPFPDNACWMNW